MKNKIKFMGIIAMTAVIMFGMAACDDGGGGGVSQTIEINADSTGEITIQLFHSIKPSGYTLTVAVTTNLPAPNNNFTLTSPQTISITGLTANQAVTVTGTTSARELSVYSSNSGTKVVFEGNHW